MLFISALPHHQQSGTHGIRKMDLNMDLKVPAVGRCGWTILEFKTTENHCNTMT